MRILFTIFFLAIAILSNSSGQESPVKFGKVTMEEMKMTNYSSDTSAPAIYLLRFGSFDAGNFEFTTQLKLKIFKREGLYLGNIIIPSNLNSVVKGVTYNLENGEIKKSKLKSESVFKERMFGQYYSFNIAMPNVQEGSVIEVEIISPGMPLKWEFQQIIPVLWSELIVPTLIYTARSIHGNLSRPITFSKNYFGYEPLKISTAVRWVGMDMPAFKEEPYMSSINNYITKFEFDNEWTWERINNLLVKNNYGGEELLFSGNLTQIAEEIKTMNLTIEDKIKAACQVIKKIKWNEYESMYYSSLADVYKKKIGNSAAINAILIQLLKKLDIKTYPVIMSTRSNGILSPFNPSLTKMNYMIALAKIGDKSILLDATEEFAPYYLLPRRAINGFGRLVAFNYTEQVDITNFRKEKISSLYDLTLREDLSLNGKISISRSDYAALDFRNAYAKFNSLDEYSSDFKKDKPGLNILNQTIQNLDSIYLPVIDEYEVNISNQVIEVGDQRYLYPLVYDQLKENPFKAEKRLFPVDYITPIEKIVISRIVIPEGYELIDIPKPVSIKLPNNAASFLYKVTYSNGILIATYKFNIQDPVFKVEDYPVLKEFYDQIIKKHNEPAILRKKV